MPSGAQFQRLEKLPLSSYWSFPSTHHMCGAAPVIELCQGQEAPGIGPSTLQRRVSWVRIPSTARLHHLLNSSEGVSSSGLRTHTILVHGGHADSPSEPVEAGSPPQCGSSPLTRPLGTLNTSFHSGRPAGLATGLWRFQKHAVHFCLGHLLLPVFSSAVSFNFYVGLSLCPLAWSSALVISAFPTVSNLRVSESKLKTKRYRVILYPADPLVVDPYPQSP